MIPKYERLLLTGAAGMLGQVLRPAMRTWATHLRVSDIEPLGPAVGNEECVTCDLADEGAVRVLMDGVDGVVHMGGISVDKPWRTIVGPNIEGVYNLYESARIQGTKRIVFASSNHAIGFRKRTERIDADDPVRPDSLYGVSKVFGEAMSRFYFDRYGIESVCLRIGSSLPEPKDRRMLVTYLSFDDLITLVQRSLFAEKADHTIVFGASANRDSWWDNSKAANLGWTPKDNTEPFRAKKEAEPPVDSTKPEHIHQGGVYVTFGPYE
ncbi:Uronate dehydrogenase [Usitatibacter rugosus]|uniref:Uronate dehydrogenase n=1 Tax=Usitatibacter rugosus TaxID=2732067 RepID=A0A6M4GUE1_9PROT|nr:NAD(P)-dependent oxidoreductase [Usitatibacter rugosus]QJR10094.1 Uronate dehydrogenase [Usitatibacter rugosus]